MLQQQQQKPRRPALIIHQQDNQVSVRALPIPTAASVASVYNNANNNKNNKNKNTSNSYSMKMSIPSEVDQPNQQNYDFDNIPSPLVSPLSPQIINNNNTKTTKNNNSNNTNNNINNTNSDMKNQLFAKDVLIAQLSTYNLTKELSLLQQTSSLQQQLQTKEKLIEQINLNDQNFHEKYKLEIQGKDTQINTYKNRLVKEQKDKKKILNDLLEKTKDNQVLYEKELLQRQQDLLLLEQLQKVSFNIIYVNYIY